MSSIPQAADLNEVRELFRRAQNADLPYPTDTSQQVSVDKEARIHVGAPSTASNDKSRVQQGIFATSRLERDQEIARRKLPANTRFLSDSGIQGWAYSFNSEIADRNYVMFAYFDGSNYQVKLISPEIEGKFNGHDVHLYTDGRLCLSDSKDSGQPTLEEAYSKSVLWANGMDVHLAGYAFPFSINNH